MIIGSCLFFIRLRMIPKGKVVTIAAFCTAAAFAAFQITIPVFGGIHLTLTPLIAIFTGPAIGSLVVLIINILSAAIGHGGFGMIGANTLVNIGEVVTAYIIYKGTKRLTIDRFARAAIATFVGLFAGNLLMIAMILVSGIQGIAQSQVQILYGLTLLAIINMGVALVEAIITGFIIGFLGRARPDLLGEGENT
ncbi:MAG: cobalt transport protein CbiM [Methanoregula sp. PtaU1.Bin051]|nr:MAG: cobalt transport protein CbiM [Methanoregula sp. PtaU1.Bin051]